jgi:hypothetical protein
MINGRQIYVAAVENSANIVSTYDMTTFTTTALSIPATYTTTSVRTNGIIFLVGIFSSSANTNSNFIYYSRDGLTWTVVSGVTTNTSAAYGGVYDFAWNGSIWVYVGANISPYIGYSTDGINWLPSSRAYMIDMQGFSAVTYNGTYFIAVQTPTSNNSLINPIFISRDGIFWKPDERCPRFRPSPYTIASQTIMPAINAIVSYEPTVLPTKLTSFGSACIAFGTNSSDVGTSVLLISPDGRNWSASSQTSLFMSNSTYNIYYPPQYNGEYWLIGGSGGKFFKSSDNGNTFTLSTTDINTISSAQVSWFFWDYIKNVWYAGDNSASTKVYLSTDGLRWLFERTLSVRIVNVLMSVVNGVQVYLGSANGSTTLLYSTNMSTFTSITTISDLYGSYYVNSIIRTNGNIFLVGVETIQGTANINTIYYSYNGLTWTPTRPTTNAGAGAICDFAWNGSIWVYVGYGITPNIGYSSNGINWTAANSTNISGVRFGSVTFNGKYFIAQRYSPTNNTEANPFYTSSDGISWSVGFSSTNIRSLPGSLASATIMPVINAMGGSALPALLSSFYTGQVTLNDGTGVTNNITLPAAYSSTSYNVFVSYLGNASGTLTPMYVTITNASSFRINGGTAGALVCWMTTGT